MCLCESCVRITLVLTIRPYSCLTHEAQLLSIQTLYNNYVHATLLFITFSHITLRIMKTIFLPKNMYEKCIFDGCNLSRINNDKHISSTYKK